MSEASEAPNIKEPSEELPLADEEVDEDDSANDDDDNDHESEAEIAEATSAVDPRSEDTTIIDNVHEQTGNGDENDGDAVDNDVDNDNDNDHADDYDEVPMNGRVSNGSFHSKR